jgi:hypothetical protein
MCHSTLGALDFFATTSQSLFNQIIKLGNIFSDHEEKRNQQRLASWKRERSPDK